MIEWKDISPFRRGGKVKESHWWIGNAGNISVRIICNPIHFLNTWFMQCDALGPKPVLEAKTFEDAKAETLNIVRKHLIEAIDAIDDKEGRE